MTAPLIHGYEVVIGFETHVQLSTHSKMFSRASTAFGAPPNTQACAIDMALPGTLPVINAQAVHCAIRFGLAVDAKIAPRSVFARKNYFYPDLPKGYQISQFDIPVVQGGLVKVEFEGASLIVRLVRAHLEEDAGKSLHEDWTGHTGIDLNRAGTPLLEIVTEPDLRSSAQAVAYARTLHKLVTWIGICDGNMQEGSFRCDANVSVRKPGAPLGTRREIKNLNSFRFMQQAIDYEVAWQIRELEEGRAIIQSTVLFAPDTGATRAMRSKEDAADYRYFPDPDLPPLHIAPAWIDEVRAEMPELPQVVADRIVHGHGLSAIDAALLTQDRDVAAYFEAAVAACGRPKAVCNWITGEMARRLEGQSIAVSPVTPAMLACLIQRVEEGILSISGAKTGFDHLWKTQPTPTDDTVPTHGKTHGKTHAATYIDALIADLGLQQLNDTGELDGIVDTVIETHPKNVAEVRSGNAKAFHALVGQVMKASRGRANPQQVNELLRQKLLG
ncbi:Asp-tRNA(Asn)/Glu-tRNA(Gln) amidotransferase subunit GatB [Candidatus Symbiobacter mobilis]|uniref:Aspartyl/glutamyl-tRNA(Asn/Gln) amidotransferase subunit B n=1 Tax=Candidatus Symbiobacter mobilis CR TaxID=946483 RepID=U5N4S0_9BURK|nr:Asp-tRNA(Asn)/Glu-tRNA(Gln) amidotransferase subunit GatB [Candidatus Symbiobacter mobilis]AGX86491.1 aspartyl/glutamyl-tRNA amidotransferase subunit B [Candidatus Symbiobacter mobilis CR]